MSRLPSVHNGELRATPDAAPIPLGTATWFSWLGAARSFTFADAAGTFTARQEERAGSHYWYAYRRREGRLRKAYLGRSNELTRERLAAVALSLAQTHHAPLRNIALEQWTSPLIATKIAAPQPGMSLMARPAIMARYLESLEHPCTIVAAPAGFGKTTLLLMATEHLQARGWRVAWVTLEETERDAVCFWRYVLEALDAAQPGISGTARRLLSTPRMPPIEHLLTLLINALAALRTPLALVLDDYHQAATEAQDHALAFLIEHAPAMLHLVISTRTDLEFLPPRLRAQGRIADLHAADLRFSPDEAGLFLRETMHLMLTPAHARRLGERTEGWAAGLQLAALSLRDHPTLPDRVVDPSSAPRHLADYVIAEVVEHQPDEVQTFLLQTAILDRLAAPLCDAVTGRSDSADMLAWLLHAQLFITPLDPALTWYRYHQLFAGVLRERLAHTAPDVLARSHYRAAQWLRQQGMVGEAIHHLIAAQALDEAATLIEDESDRLVLRGEITRLTTWVQALPRDILLAHPHLCILFTLGLVFQGERDNASAWLDAVESREIAQGQPSSTTVGEVVAVRAILRLMVSDFSGGTALARTALEQLPPEAFLLRAISLWLINSLGMIDDHDLAEVNARMTAIAEESRYAGNMFVAFMALITRAGIELYQGHLQRMARTCREALRMLPRPNGEESPMSAMAYCMLAEIQRESNDLAGAEAQIRHALAIGLYPSNAEFLLDGLLSLALLQAERGQGDEALATFEEIEQLIHLQHLAAVDTDQMAIMRVRVWLMHGHLAEAIQWADEYRTSTRQSVQFIILRDALDLALARVTLARGQAGEVIASLADMYARARAAGRGRTMLEAKLLLARAHWALGATPAAFQDVQAALTFAAPEGFMRLVLDEGEAMADLLAAYVANHPSSRERTYALKLLAAFGRPVERAPEPPIATLSARELDVLRLLAAGKSNDAIAAELIVAVSTVKWHAAQMYRKLGVNGRVQAIARARALRLIA